MLIRQVALVSITQQLSPADLTPVAAALQKQVCRDFGPLWRIDATVDAFARLEDVPLGYWPIVVADDIQTPGAAGVHEDDNGQPFALVQFSDGWTLTASHECLEMLADPFGKRIIAGPSIKPGEGRVEYLVEVCDPSEAEEFAYTANDVVVSDFYTPHFFDPKPAPGVKYSFTGAIPGPREVLRGGYISWHNPATDHWEQQVFFGGGKEFRDLGVLGRLTGSIRETIDRLTPTPLEQRPPSRQSGLMAQAYSSQQATQKATGSKAARWRAQIEKLTAER